MLVQLYIAMYKTNADRKYHRALIPSDAGVPFIDAPIRVFQITDHFDDETGKRYWEYKPDALFVLAHSARFLGLVSLPPCSSDWSFEEVIEVLEAVRSIPEDVTKSGRHWSCARWVVDVLRQYGSVFGINFDSWVLEKEENLYYTI